MTDKLYMSATAMFPLPPDVWDRNDIKWLAQRCAFLIKLRDQRNEFFHGTDVQQGKEFNDEIKRILKQSFMPELQTFINEYPEMYNELWYDIFFDDQE